MGNWSVHLSSSVGNIRNLWVKVLITAIYNSCVSMENQKWFSKGHVDTNKEAETTDEL